MPDEDVDLKRRKFLVKATTTMGAAGIVATAIPFVASMLPSKTAEAAGAPVEVDISDMKPGDQRTVEWRGRPVWIVRRSQEMLDTLFRIEDKLRDPNSRVDQQPKYAENRYRSIKPEFLVLVGICTHLGCVPTYRPDTGGISDEWEGGFFCSCHGSKFDLAGRVFKGVPAPINLEVPPYTFVRENILLIGTDEPPEVV